ncbi:MAG: InlB B-repeat-containing protein, partial [Micrococcales bacterium]|nr:InlB B-repeat-containing protein [Micrococcales bacterium]
AFFVGWSLDQSSSVADPALAPGNDLLLSQDLDLYAVWLADLPTGQYAVGYSANGGTGTVAPEGYLDDGDPFTVADPAGSLTPPKGMKFAGWSLDPAAALGDPAYVPGDPASSMTGDVILYAVWQWNDPFDVIYHECAGGSSLSDPNSSYPEDLAVTVISGQGLVPPADSDFEGWSDNPAACAGAPLLAHAGPGASIALINTKVSGPIAAAYAPGATFDMPDHDVHLYAVWRTFDRFAVTYHANGGTGSVVDGRSPYLYVDRPSLVHTSELAVVLSASGLSAPTGKHFDGWATKAAASKADAAWSPGRSFTVSGPVNLYAVWVADAVPAPLPTPVAPPVTPGPDTDRPDQDVPGTGGDFDSGDSGQPWQGGDQQRYGARSRFSYPAPWGWYGGSSITDQDRLPSVLSKPSTTQSQQTQDDGQRLAEDETNVEVSPSRGVLQPSGSWALVNLLLAAAGLVLAVLAERGWAVSRRHQGLVSNGGSAARYWALAGIVAGLLGVVVVALTQDFSASMGLVDKWTLVNLALASVGAAAALLPRLNRQIAN